MVAIFQFISVIFLCQVTLLSCSPPSQFSCPRDQSLALLEFKKTFSANSSNSTGFSSCAQGSYPRTNSWKRSKDCCNWDGVTCDEANGQIIGLDLSCSGLVGAITSNSTLFQLSLLQKLNLAYNDFSSSKGIPHKFGTLASLTHLNLSYSDFSGHFPSEILRLSQLTSLDLSGNLRVSFEPLQFHLLLQNLSHLSELFLSGTTIPSVFPGNNVSSSLTILSLSNTGLYGELPENIFHLRNLQSLAMSGNFNLTGHLPNIKWNSSASLKELDLSFTKFSGELPYLIGYVETLNLLDLSNCQFSGSIPQSLGNLTQLNLLWLSHNFFSGQLPPQVSTLQQLALLDMGYNHLQGPIPDAFGSLKKLQSLYLSGNNFEGHFPSSVTKLNRLEILDLYGNSLTGLIPSFVSGFQNLAELSLGNNSLNGTIPSWLFNLPPLVLLDLSSNQLTGQISEFEAKSLRVIDLSGNNLQGLIPKSVSELVNLTDIYLSSNNFTGEVEAGTFSNLKQLTRLDLSDSGLSLTSTNSAANDFLPASLEYLFLSSCNIKELDFLRDATNLFNIDLSNNKLQGRIPSWAWSNWESSVTHLNLSRNFLTDVEQLDQLRHIGLLDLRSNLLQGQLPIPAVTMAYFFVSNNSFTGEIPPSICNLTTVLILDLSDNFLSGAIPQCLGNLSQYLSVLDLHMNLLSGTIPTSFVLGNPLRSLNLRENQLKGTVPRSLANCLRLQVLDIGSNLLNDTFPMWLGMLPNLTVLSLRSNKFHGMLSVSKKAIKNAFTGLRILDLSNNDFSGAIPELLLQNLKSMAEKEDAEVGKPLAYLGELYYQDSVMVVTKGNKYDLVRVLSIFTTIDLSWNRFEGMIPNVIGNLISLRALNLSRNAFGGEIPPQLGNLSVLESLDLSWNRISGEIPQQLTALTSLSTLNLSQNHLAGRIPGGNQFSTFENNSYVGNSGLCGFPLSKECGDYPTLMPQPSPPSLILHQGYEVDDFMDGFTWKAVLIGYGCGMVIGIVMGCLIFLTRKPVWLIRIIEENEQRMMMLKKKNAVVKGIRNW